jgi:hypothetical protein
MAILAAALGNTLLCISPAPTPFACYPISWAKTQLNYKIGCTWSAVKSVSHECHFSQLDSTI